MTIEEQNCKEKVNKKIMIVKNVKDKTGPAIHHNDDYNVFHWILRVSLVVIPTSLHIIFSSPYNDNMAVVS